MLETKEYSFINLQCYLNGEKAKLGENSFFRSYLRFLVQRTKFCYNEDIVNKSKRGYGLVQ